MRTRLQKKSWSIEANVLAVWLDVAPRAEQAAILRRGLASKPDAQTTVEGWAVPAMFKPTYYFRFYLSRALEHTGMADLYLEQLQPWYDMLRLGLSTWAENPEATWSDLPCVERHPKLRPAHAGGGHPAGRAGI
jgi:alpha-L-rhamnosidase